jgi:hypothetical protein
MLTSDVSNESDKARAGRALNDLAEALLQASRIIM